MDNTAEILGGVSVKDVAEGGVVFDVNYMDKTEDDTKRDEECSIMLDHYLKFECLDFGNRYDGNEPFANIAKKMQNLLQNGKIKKRILREGYGPKPEPSSNVYVHYNAYAQYEAQPFDSTYARKQAFSFKTGEGEVIEGLEIAVLSMQINEKSQFLIDSELAYRSGVLGRIPADATVLFEIELSEVQQKTGDSPEVNSKQFEHVYPLCLALSVKGKKMVKLNDYSGAIKQYKSAVSKLEDAILEDYEDQTKSEELLVRICTNLLVCCTLSKQPKLGCVYAQKIYEMSKNGTFKVSAKVYFNHSKCQTMLGGFTLARRLLSQARTLEPDNQEIKKEFVAIQEAQKKYQKHEKNLGRALLSP